MKINDFKQFQKKQVKDFQQFEKITQGMTLREEDEYDNYGNHDVPLVRRSKNQQMNQSRVVPPELPPRDEHSTSVHHHKQPINRQAPSHNDNECPMKNACRNTKCSLLHPDQIPCKYGETCQRSGCFYKHTNDNVPAYPVHPVHPQTKQKTIPAKIPKQFPIRKN